MRNPTALFATLLFSLCGVSALAADQVDSVLLADAGKAAASIVIPDDPSPAVSAAAGDLRDYLAKITGAQFPIIVEGKVATGMRLDVGPTQVTRTLLPRDFASDPERVWIQTHPQGVSLCGGGDPGTTFAVYQFLERLGCRWLTPKDEVVPRIGRLTVQPLRIDTQPGFVWRSFAGHQNGKWGLKLGMNGFYPPDSAAAECGNLFWPPGITGFHAYHQIIPEDTFGKHPEWSPLRGGKRVPTGEFMQLCVTAPGLADEFAANVVRALKKDPAAPVVSISPNDGYRWCECAECLSLDRKLCGGRTTGQGLDRTSPPFVGDRVFWFANEIARRVALDEPNKKLAVLAYVNYLEPPDIIRPAPNIIPVLCHYAPADYSRAMNDGTSAANREFDAILKRWTAISPDVMIYSYVDKSMWWRLPRPVTRTFAADVKHLHQRGVRKYYCQSTLDDWPLHGPLYYVTAKLLWNPTADPDSPAKDWIRSMFGAGAADMETYYAAVETAVTKTGKPFSDDPSGQAVGLYDPASLRAATAALERAAKAAATDKPASRRIAAVERTFRYGCHMIEGFEQAAKWWTNGDRAHEDAARAAGRRAIELAEAPPDSAEFMNNWDAYVSIGAAMRSIGKEVEKGGRRCWNTDETGPGDGKAGFATFRHRYPGPGVSLTIEMDVWGESRIDSISVSSRADTWILIRPEKQISGKPRWETLRFHIPADVLDSSRVHQTFGCGGGDSQIHIASIRVLEKAND